MKLNLLTTFLAKTKLLFILLFFVFLCLNAACAQQNIFKSQSKNIAIKDFEKKFEKLNSRISELEQRLDEFDIKLRKQSELEISGFFDVGISNYNNKPDIFYIGNFELDIKHSYENNFQVAAALVFDDEKGTYLGVGFIDYSLSGNTIKARGRLFREKGTHIQVGRFDVPLGNDWNHASAIDRISVTSPLTTSHIMEGVYNDVGLRFLSNLVAFNISLYITHGTEDKESYGGNSYGTRIGITPFSNPYTIRKNAAPVLELGFSFLHDSDADGNKSEEIFVVDYESEIQSFFIRSEYYTREKVVGVRLLGYHLTTGFHLNNILPVNATYFLRYGHYKETNTVINSFEQAYLGNSDQIDYLTRITTGFNLNISDISHLKFEYHTYIDSTEKFTTQGDFNRSLYYAQLVITF